MGKVATLSVTKLRLRASNKLENLGVVGVAGLVLCQGCRCYRARCRRSLEWPRAPRYAGLFTQSQSHATLAHLKVVTCITKDERQAC